MAVERISDKLMPCIDMLYLAGKLLIRVDADTSKTISNARSVSAFCKDEPAFLAGKLGIIKIEDPKPDL